LAKRAAEFDFERALQELEATVGRMEKGDLGLEEALHHFERGIELTRACQKALADAEQRVHMLLEGNGREPEIVPVDDE
jgi:exodeoxyribonuclease VII small subunit